MDAAAATLPPFGPGLALPLTVPLSVSQPHTHPQVGVSANAHARTHANSHLPQTHALAKPRASADAQIIADNHSLDSAGDAWRWREEEMDAEEHESDFSHFQGDESARSSCVTTPDIHVSRPPPPPPDDFKQGQMFDESSPEPYLLSPVEYQNKRASRLSSLSPPPPPPPPPNATNESMLPRYLPPPPPPPPPAQSDGQTRFFPPPPPPPGFDQHAFRANEAMNRVLQPPPPPPPPRSRSPAESLELDDQDSTPQPSRPYKILPRIFGKPPSITTSDEKSYQSRRGRTRRRHRRHSRDHSSGSTYSRTRPSTTQPSDSGSTSEEDLIQYRNARQFPPRLPTAPPYGSPGTDSKASINRITAWVADYEKTRSPRRLPPAEITTGSPPRDSDAYSDYGERDSSASDISSEGEIEMLWTQLKEKRTRLNDIKSQMAKRRKELRELRRKKNDADNAFMSVIRPMLVNHRGISAGHLERRLNDMQALRSDYHFLEDSYETLEITLDEEEARLNTLETRFFSLLAAGRTRPERRQADKDPEQEQREYFKNMPLILKGISPDGPPEDRHPLYLELMDTVGDLGNAKEEYEDLVISKEECTYIMETNRSAGKPEDEGAAEFLAEFPEQEQHLSSSIAKFQEGVTRLKELCEEKGVMHKNMSARVEYLLYPEKEYQDMDLEEKEAILERQHDLSHHRFPVLLSQHQHILGNDTPRTSLGALKAAVKLPDEAPEKKNKMQQALKEYAIDNLIMGYDTDRKSDFINRWLMQQLRTSPMNTALLHSAFVEKNGLKIRDFWRWQSDVLHYWWHDGGLAEESFKPILTSEGSQYRVGTTLPSRAASDGYNIHVRRQQRTNSTKTLATVA